MARQNLDQAYSALADPTRRAILRKLAVGEARVTEVAREFPVSLNAVSKHILVLERAGLVRRRIDGRDHYLSADPAPLAAARRWIEEQENFGKPESVITAAVDVTDFLEHKRRAMKVHASQISEQSFFLQMPPDAFAYGFGTEWFIREGEGPGITETDLL